MYTFHSTAVFCSYLRVKLRQLLFIEVGLGVDTSFVAELKHKSECQLTLCLVLHIYLLAAVFAPCHW